MYLAGREKAFIDQLASIVWLGAAPCASLSLSQSATAFGTSGGSRDRVLKRPGLRSPQPRPVSSLFAQPQT